MKYVDLPPDKENELKVKFDALCAEYGVVIQLGMWAKVPVPEDSQDHINHEVPVPVEDSPIPKSTLVTSEV